LKAESLRQKRTAAKERAESLKDHLFVHIEQEVSAKRMTRACSRVFKVLLSFAKVSGGELKCRPSVDKISKASGVSRSQVLRHISWLRGRYITDIKTSTPENKETTIRIFRDIRDNEGKPFDHEVYKTEFVNRQNKYKCYDDEEEFEDPSIALQATTVAPDLEAIHRPKVSRLNSLRQAPQYAFCGAD
jgi:DNA-binding transcriptional ArsR family regulator